MRQFLLTNLKRDAHGDGYSFRVPFETLGDSLEKLGQFDFVPGQDKFEGKTLFIKGNKSGYIREKELDAIRTFFPRARVEGLDTGHWGKDIRNGKASIVHVGGWIIDDISKCKKRMRLTQYSLLYTHLNCDQ